MKKIISSLVFILIVINLYSQKTTEYELNRDYIYGFIMLAGLVMDIASIPLFISASVNKNRAARLEFGNQISYQPHNSLMVLQKQSVPSLTLGISF